MGSGGNDLWTYFRNNDGRLVHKWLHYFDIYERHFSQFRGRSITLVEIGVFQGGSLDMWRAFFGPDAKIVGVDIEPRAAELETPGTEIVIGDQADPAFLERLAEHVGPIDVLIDDGGHTIEQQMATFRVLWPHVRDAGVVLVEDLHTNYWEEYGGGYERPGTFIEFAKSIIDAQNAWHSRSPNLRVGDLTKSIRGLHSYDSVIVLEKADVREPVVAMTGTPSWDPASGEPWTSAPGSLTKDDVPGAAALAQMWERVQSQGLELNRRWEELNRIDAELARTRERVTEIETQAAQLDTAQAQLIGLDRAKSAEIADLKRTARGSFAARMRRARTRIGRHLKRR